MNAHIQSNEHLSKPLEQWSIPEVISWLQSINMSRYAGKFRKNLLE